MPVVTEFDGVYVSLQAPGFGYTALERHRFGGFLTGESRAVFLDIPQRFLIESTCWDLLMVRPPVPEKGSVPVVERQRATCVEVHKGVGRKANEAGDDLLLAAVFDLPAPCHLFECPNEKVEHAHIDALYRKHRSIAKVFEESGIHAGGLPDPSSILARLGVVDQVGHVADTVLHFPEATSTPGAVSGEVEALYTHVSCSICCWCCWCTCDCTHASRQDGASTVATLGGS